MSTHALAVAMTGMGVCAGVLRILVTRDLMGGVIRCAAIVAAIIVAASPRRSVPRGALPAS